MRSRTLLLLLAALASGCRPDPSFWDVVDAYRAAAMQDYARCEDIDDDAIFLCSDEPSPPNATFEAAVACLTAAWQECTPAEAQLRWHDGNAGHPFVHVFIEPDADGCRLRVFRTDIIHRHTATELECTDLRFTGACMALDLAPCTELATHTISHPSDYEG